MYKLLEGMHPCQTCGKPVWDTVGYYCSKHCEAIGECGE
jgi:hypothetical protein